MSFSVLPVSTPFAIPVAAETHKGAIDRRAHDEANRRRHRHPPANAPSPVEPEASSPDPNLRPRLGTLIDVQA